MAEPLKIERYTRTSRVALPVAAVVVIAAATIPAWGSSNIMKQAVTFLTLVALAQMWNLLAGYAGLVSVGQQAFVGIGGYALWVFSEKVGLNPFVCVPIAGLVAALFAVPTAGLAFRLRGGYFAVGTWVIAEVYRLLVVQIGWLGGGSGVSINSAVQVERGTREAVVFWLALAVAAGSIALVYLLLRSRRGLALTAIRDDEMGARGLGVNVFRSKLWVYIIAAFGTGVTGAVIYLNLLRLQPEAGFGLNWSALMIFAVVIGGLGTIEGPIIGAIIYFVLQQLFSDYGTWYLILIGALAAVVVVFARRGLWGTLVRRRAIDLFPVRRRLCLETVCFPEEASPGDPAVGQAAPEEPQKVE
ncbi:MAG: branched-chain amino acid ABC transporter permease [Thermoleophilia bacterium]|nr:branched-chain amino acid ABC transporter permease [Thermoleophilia bacterium]